MTDHDDSHELDENALIEHTASIVSAFAGATHMSEDALASAIRRVHSELKNLHAPPPAAAPAQQELVPAVPVKKSITNDYLICLEDGAKLKMLKRYLRTRFNMTPAEYRAKWNLPRDYPMVAPAYAERRSELAKEIGLGRTAATARRSQGAAAPAKEARKAPRKNSRAG